MISVMVRARAIEASSVEACVPASSSIARSRRGLVAVVIVDRHAEAQGQQGDREDQGDQGEPAHGFCRESAARSRSLERLRPLPWGHGRLSREAAAGRARAATARASTGPCRRVEHALELHGAPVYVRKEIVHNKHVVEQLRERGAIFVEELDDSIPEGAVTVFSAHGVSPAVHAEADRRGLNTIDATCPLVTKVHREALKFAAEGYTIVLIGHEGHEEVEGTMGEAPEHIVLVETEADVDALEVADPEKLAYVSQTTLSVDETRAIINRLRERFPAIIGPRTDDICYATTNRQAAVKQMAPLCDLVLVIGSRNSSNSNRLVEVAREHGADSLPDRQRGAGPRGVAGGHARRRHHLRRQRAGGARPAPGRLLPRAGDRGRRGVPGRPGGRALHAPQDDPPGAGRSVGVSLSDHARANRIAWVSGR